MNVHEDRGENNLISLCLQSIEEQNLELVSTEFDCREFMGRMSAHVEVGEQDVSQNVVGQPMIPNVGHTVPLDTGLVNLRTDKH